MNKVSVIVPNYNHSLFLKKRIDSILAQTYANFELIILDDFSTDDSINIINQYKDHPKVTAIIVNKENSGSTFKQWEKGIKTADGDIIWIAESDDFAAPLFLDKAVSVMNNDNSIGIVHFRSYSVNQNNALKGFAPVYNTYYDWDKDFKEEGKIFIKNSMLTDNSLINASAIVFKKDLVKQHMINTQYTLNGDWYFYLNILLQTNFYHISEPLNYFRHHENNTTSRNIKNHNNLKEYADILYFAFTRLNLTEDDKDVLKSIYIKKWLNQNNHKLSNLLKNRFFSIARKASRIDKLFMFRLIKYYTENPKI